MHYKSFTISINRSREYAPGSLVLGQEQSGSAILALRLAMFVIPNVLALVQVILSCMYPLSQEKMEEVNTELEMRHSNPNHVPVDVQL